jgi:hypothetical protein
MPILNINGVTRKPGIGDSVIKGSIFNPGIAAKQHGTTTVAGTSYNSPFTPSNKPIFGASHNNSTQPALVATKVSEPGQVVPVNSFQKVQPQQRGSFFATNTAARPVTGRVGGPSSKANTPASPNAPKLTRVAPPKLVPNAHPARTHVGGFFAHAGGGTITSHANMSSTVDRWSVKKTGAAG